MKKKLLKSMRALLVAAGLCVGAGAWADESSTTTTYTFEDENPVFTGQSRVTVAIEDNDALSSKVVAFTCAHNAQNGYSFANYNFSSLLGDAYKVTLNFDCYFTEGGRGIIAIGDGTVRGTTGGNSSSNRYNTDGVIFRLGLSNNSNNYGVVNETTNLAKASYCGVWLNVNVVVDTEAEKVSYVIKNKSTDTVVKSETDIDYYGSNVTECTQIDINGYINNSKMVLIDNLAITATVDNSKVPVGYTIKYVDGNGDDIKTADTSRTGFAGAGITLLNSDKDAVYANEKKYIYDSDDANGKTIASDGTTVVTVTFREAASYSYTINAKYGDDVLETIGSGSVFEGDRASAVQQLYYLVEGGVLVKNNNGGAADYTHSFYPNTDGQAEYIVYTDDKENVVFFSEAEDIPSLTAITSNYLAERFSGRQGAYAKDEAQVITTLAPGKYKLTAQILGTQSVATFTFKAGSETIWENATSSESYYVSEGITSDEFTLTETTDITLEAAGGNGSSSRVTNAVDFIYIQKTGDATALTGTIASSGYSSLASAYDLDFSSATGLTAAYVVTATTNDAVTLTSVDELPANSGVILKGTAGAAYSIPVKADAAYAGTNLLSAAVTATDIEANTAYILQGGLFHLVTAASTVPAGKAYLLKSNVPSAARALGFAFVDNEATGINSVSSDRQNGEFYNLQGQCVDAPKKGLYIVNGVKVIIK